jgi:hypothetical protein
LGARSVTRSFAKQPVVRRSEAAKVKDAVVEGDTRDRSRWLGAEQGAMDRVESKQV